MSDVLLFARRVVEAEEEVALEVGLNGEEGLEENVEEMDEVEVGEEGVCSHPHLTTAGEREV